MAAGGFIALHRTILDWEWYHDINTTRVFVHLLLTANHQQITVNGQKIKRGQRVCSNAVLAQETGLSIQNVKTSLAKLESTREITRRVTRGQHGNYSVITVTNYTKFQDHQPKEQPDHQPEVNPTLTRGQPEVNPISYLRNNETMKQGKQNTRVRAHAWGDVSDKLLETLKKFEEMRNKVKAPMTDHAKKLLLSRLRKMASDEETQIAILEQSIERSWKGIFELKGDTKHIDNSAGHKKSAEDYAAYENWSCNYIKAFLEEDVV